MDWLTASWHWSLSGTMISILMFWMTWLGKSFGVSTSYNTICSTLGLGKKIKLFDIDIKKEAWRIFFVIGTVFGGFIASHFLQSSSPLAISDTTIQALENLGYSYPNMDDKGLGIFPTQLFNFSSPKGVFLAWLGGVLIGFGARYAGGCTSGHAITGLSHLQLPSLVTVVGFFIGGLVMVHFILPLLF